MTDLVMVEEDGPSGGEFLAITIAISADLLHDQSRWIERPIP